jgi:hypothetical protein
MEIEMIINRPRLFGVKVSMSGGNLSMSIGKESISVGNLSMSGGKVSISVGNLSISGGKE